MGQSVRSAHAEAFRQLETKPAPNWRELQRAAFLKANPNISASGVNKYGHALSTQGGGLLGYRGDPELDRLGKYSQEYRPGLTPVYGATSITVTPELRSPQQYASFLKSNTAAAYKDTIARAVAGKAKHARFKKGLLAATAISFAGIGALGLAPGGLTAVGSGQAATSAGASAATAGAGASTKAFSVKSFLANRLKSTVVSQIGSKLLGSFSGGSSSGGTSVPTQASTPNIPEAAVPTVPAQAAQSRRASTGARVVIGSGARVSGRGGTRQAGDVIGGLGGAGINL